MAGHLHRPNEAFAAFRTSVPRTLDEVVRAPTSFNSSLICVDAIEHRLAVCAERGITDQVVRTKPLGSPACTITKTSKPCTLRVMRCWPDCATSAFRAI